MRFFIIKNLKLDIIRVMKGVDLMLLEPILIKNTTFKNRVVMPPMCMYSVFKKDGFLTDFHFAHYVNRAIGGVGYIIIESTAIVPEGRISLEDLGIWSDEHIDKFKKLVDTLHQYGAKVALQINHAGRKSRIMPNVSSSAVSFSEQFQTPKELTIDEIKDVVKAFGQAARRANEAGFDGLEIHAAHGYLINQFMSPLVNSRDDQYQDGAIFLKEIIKEIRKYWPKDKILQLRITAYEYSEEGLTPYDWAGVLNQIKDDIDLVHISSGGTIPVVVKDYPGYQIAYSRIIKEETGMLTIAGGLIDDLTLAKDTLKEGSADMIFFGRKLLREPYFLLNETNIDWPIQYLRAKLKKDE